VPRFRLTQSAETDLGRILTVSAERWGTEARLRYEALLFDAFQQLAARPEGPLTRNQSDVGPHLRSFHVRHTQRQPRGEHVRRPVHVIYYRAVQPDVVEIVRVLHERMEPTRHLGAVPGEEE
jgi:toxin ParE1/3/4